MTTVDTLTLAEGDLLMVEVTMSGLVTWRSDCPTCVINGRGAFAPSHDASPSCESGKRPHCTCSGCF